MGRLTRLTLFTSAIGAGIGALIMPNPASATTIQDQYATHSVTVTAGDTLSGIATRLGTNWPALASYNHLANPNLIFPGQQLSVPPSGWSGSDPAPTSSSSVRTTESQPSSYTSSYTPSHTTSSSGSSISGSSSFERCVIQHESGGNPQVWGGAGGHYWGLYQFSYSTWVANGGSPSSYGNASAAQQHQVFVNSSPSNWAPYDGC